MSSNVDVVIVGSIGIDTIETPLEKRNEILGGSLSYACTAASFFSTVGMVGVVGNDFRPEYRALYAKFGINLDGLQQIDGKTFRWSGIYEDDMINRRTVSTDLNVLEVFSPVIPASFQNAPYLLLGNITPGLQLSVLEQMKDVQFVVADTMDLWINIARDSLNDVIARVNMLMLNDSEARLLTGRNNLRECAETILSMGPQYVVVKKGEHGAILVSGNGIFLVPAFPVNTVVDPTGAGDSFAGGFIGRLAERAIDGEVAIREALLYGSVVASIGVEDFGLDNLIRTGKKEIEKRFAELKDMVRV